MRVLLAIDDDPARHHAIAAVRDWLPSDVDVVALHVDYPARASAPSEVPVREGLVGYTSSPLGYTLPAVGPLPSTTQAIDEQAEQTAGWAATIVDGEARVEVGDPPDTITRVAKEIDADLIVVGTGDRSWLSRLMNPSIGAEVVNDAPCSVLLVRQRRRIDE